jgi:hypothetical protein
MKYTVGKEETFSTMGYCIKRNNKKIAEFWHREDAELFKKAIIMYELKGKKMKR